MNLGILPFYGFQPLYYSQKFHPVIGCLRKTSRELQHLSCTFEDHPIASGAGIAT